MYSIVMMMALSGSAEAPECHHRCCGCTGYYSGCYGCRCYGGYGCYGCYGGYGCSCYGYYSGAGYAPVVTPPPPPAPRMGYGYPQPSAPQPVAAGPASVRVSLPADAVLTVNGVATSATTASRMFETPLLQPGVVYQYTMSAQIVRQGQTMVQSQTIQVQAGRETQVQFQFADAAQSVGR